MSTYAPYVAPSLSVILMAFGPFPKQPIYDGVLSYEADAQAYATAIGAKLLNAATTPSLGVSFTGITPTDAAQPWVVQWAPTDPIFFAGIAINQQVAASGGTTQHPGDWLQQPSGVWLFVPKSATVPPPTTTANPADAAAWAAIMGAGTLTEVQKDAILVAIAVAVGAKVPQ